MVTRFHPAADAFPMYDQDELNALAIDILNKGLRQPIVMTPEWEVLDGRNRLAACELVNVEPEFVVHDGDPWDYSRSLNLWRRNMTTGQRAAACAMSLIAEGKRANGRWARGSVPGDEGDNRESSVSHAWEQAMRQAGLVADWSVDGDLLIAVRNGSMALDGAYGKAKARKDKADWEAEQERKKREREIAANDAELAALLSLAHNQLNLSTALMDAAVDDDNWRSVATLADKVIALWTRYKEKANARLEA